MKRKKLYRQYFFVAKKRNALSLETENQKWQIATRSYENQSKCKNTINFTINFSPDCRCLSSHTYCRCALRSPVTDNIHNRSDNKSSHSSNE